MINWKEVARLSKNSEISIDVPSGPVWAEARIDWCGSNTLSLDAQPGKAITIEVTNTYGAWRAAWAVTARPYNYLTLTRV